MSLYITAKGRLVFKSHGDFHTALTLLVENGFLCEHEEFGYQWLNEAKGFRFNDRGETEPESAVNAPQMAITIDEGNYRNLLANIKKVWSTCTQGSQFAYYTSDGEYLACVYDVNTGDKHGGRGTDEILSLAGQSQNQLVRDAFEMDVETFEKAYTQFEYDEIIDDTLAEAVAVLEARL